MSYFSWLRVGSTMVAALSFAILLSGPVAAAQPSGHSASTCAKLASGKPVNVSISKPGQQLCYTFPATAGKNVAFDVTKFDITDTGPGNVAEIFLYFYEPDGTAVTDCSFEGNYYCNFTPTVSGTWSVMLVPYEDSVGSLTLTFASDLPTQALTSGKSVTTTIRHQGQQAEYTFPATAGKNVAFDVTKFHFTDAGPGNVAEIFLDFYEPNGSADGGCSFEGPGTCPLTPSVSGTWSITLVPYEASVGSLTLELT
jgi:hypothetical protein